MKYTLTEYGYEKKTLLLGLEWRYSPHGLEFYVGAWWHVSFHRREHHPEILFGAWKLYVNGIQLFAGKWAVTMHWPVRRILERAA